jgi:hypothetical protein
MYSAFALIYLVPATCFLLGIWMCLRILVEFGVGVLGRRFCFVALATLLLAPSVAGAIIVTTWVPNGLLLLAGALPMHHQPRLVVFAFLSFSMTTLVSIAVAWVCIRQREQGIPSNVRRLTRIGIPLAAIGLLLGFDYAMFPDREIPEHIDWSLVESEFGG